MARKNGYESYSKERLLELYNSERIRFSEHPENENHYCLYKEAVENVVNENEEEKMIHNFLDSIYHIDLPFYVSVRLNKRFRDRAYYITPGARITLYKNGFDTESDVGYEHYRKIWIHEYAHHVIKYFTTFDTEMHGLVFQSVLYVLLRLADEKDLFHCHYLENNYIKNVFLKNNPLFEAVCKDMGFDCNYILKPELVTYGTPGVKYKVV